MDKKESEKKGPVGTTGVRKAPNVLGMGILLVVLIVAAAWGGLTAYDSRITSYNVCYTKLLRVFYRNPWRDHLRQSRE